MTESGAMEAWEIRRELRELRLQVDGLTEGIIGRPKTAQWVARVQLTGEHPAFKLDLPSRACTSIRLLWPGSGKIVTLEDLSYFPRSFIAAVDQVGPGTMKILDAALSDAGLNWADEAQDCGDGVTAQ